MSRLTPDDKSEASSAVDVDGLAIARLALETAVARAERLQRQRDEARDQRDEARVQRDEAREQRDNLGRLLDTALADDQMAVTLDERAGDQPTAGGRRGRLRKRAPAGFAALPKSDLPSRAYSVGKYEEREKARQRIERRLPPRSDADHPLTLLEREIRASRKVPRMRRFSGPLNPPGDDVAFVTVSDIGFFPGLLGLVLSLLDVYPQFSSTLFVYHDGSISLFAQERLIDVYPNIEFVQPDMDWLDLSKAEAADAKSRIGKLGYMKFMALTLSGYRRVVILDSDLMILDDISALWTGGTMEARASYDLGNREFAVKSDYTGSWIINSGVISLPGHWCTPDAFKGVQHLISTNLRALGDLIDQFADQKAWNIFLSARPISYLEVNFNCNVKYVGRFLGGKLEGVSVLHFAGPKPWNSIDYLPQELLATTRSMACVFPNMWINRYRALLFKNRSLSFRRDQQAWLKKPSASDAERPTRSCYLTDDASRIVGEQIAGFRGDDVIHVVHRELPSFIEDLAPKHVVFASHEFLGGWNTFDPQIPNDCAQRLGQMNPRPTIWAPYYFKPMFEILARKYGLEIRYLLHEAPFVRLAGDVGIADCSIDGFIDSCGDDTLTFGAPIARALGYREVIVVKDYRDHGEIGPHLAEPSNGVVGRSGVDVIPAAVSLLIEGLREQNIELRFCGSALDGPFLEERSEIAAHATGQ